MTIKPLLNWLICEIDEMFVFAVDESSKSSKGLPKTVQKRSQVLVTGKVSNPDLELSLSTSEKYLLSLKSVTSEKVRNEIRVLIEAKTFYGFRHALETLSQLITYDPTGKCLRIPGERKLNFSMELNTGHLNTGRHGAFKNWTPFKPKRIKSDLPRVWILNGQISYPHCAGLNPIKVPRKFFCFLSLQKNFLFSRKKFWIS